jgi:hypothetical protein
MKSGTGDDPFADDVSNDTDDEEPIETESSTQTEADSETEQHDSVDSSEKRESATETSETPESQTTTGADESDEQIDSKDIPWVLRRSGVKDDRPNMTQFFLRDATDEAERGFQQDVENILNKDVYLLDLREAAYQVAMEHPDEVANVLEDWGYDYL